MSTAIILSAKTHTKWKHAIKAIALSSGGWGILNRKSKIPYSNPTDATEKKENCNWKKGKEKVAGAIYATLDKAHQNLMAISYRDAEHPTETLSEFGNRVVDGSKKLQELIPDESKLINATMTQATVTCANTPAHPVTVAQEVLTQATISPGFTVKMFIDELAINVILIGLGRTEDMQRLKHTLIQTGFKSLTDILTTLQKEDTLNKSDKMNTANTSALAA
ncbi:hypothetical protein M407DRAFT_29260 [Tulasnella calospora MUT 4182]|uniref:Uncharacterized protein n=1 Tax=Tulasnella calospora MUT 4182 TaxID=1051891 RepID=A0A0C3PZT1_9AGAM|nr:hypothetical protein M407DRAFT_29260 [Tulasnella calospora MUT 4182]